MKTITLIISIAIASFSVTTSYAQDKGATTEKASYKLASFGVRGNCGMCKATIEKAANAVDGVRSAVWNKDAKQVIVSYDPAKTSLDKIHAAIANSGYDTEKVTASKKAYNGLAGCCQYDRKQKMNQKLKKESGGHDHGGHDHSGHQH
ncbi:MAG: heavy-metal-associated domain-containing protein [Fluviicola sp.]|nr:heavy-metal-associated domain-containing protein [Fluviicola sp.]